MSTQKVRVAAVQFGAGMDVEANLATCLRMIDEAARHKPDLMVLPEFVNHASWYDDKDHCYKVSVAMDGPFLQAISAKAKEHQCVIVVNATVQRGDGIATGTSMMFGQEGELLAESDKQVLMGHENDFLRRAQGACTIVDLPFARVAMYACMDGVINETPRGLALRGAQILCNSLNSFARDEASLHVPVRAAENKVFVVAANKVDPLIPEFLLEPVSQQTSIPVEYLHGAGESQIVAPDGSVLAKAPLTGDAVVIAEIEVAQADDKRRPDGTDIFGARRPELYRALAAEPGLREYEKGAESIGAAVYQPRAEGREAVEEAADAVALAARDGAQLIVLPELFCVEGGRVSDPAAAAGLCAEAVDALAAAIRSSGADACAVTSIAESVPGGYAHSAVLIGAEGVIARQRQLHRIARHAGWVTQLGESLEVIQMGWGRLALIVGDDSIFPESFRLAALQNAEVVALPMQLQEAWELRLGLLERAAENRVCLVIASRPGPQGQSAVMSLHDDFTLMTPWKERPFDGNISTPVVTYASSEPGLTSAPIHPRRAENRFVSHRTDLVDGRPWYLLDAIIAE